MSDGYINFANSSLGQTLIKSFGLPNPEILDRYEAGQDFIRGSLLLGAAEGAELSSAIAKTLGNSQSPILTSGDTAAKALKSAKLSAASYTPNEEDGQKFGALVFDASGIKNSAQLRQMYDFFHPVARKMAKSGRLIVIGRTPELCKDPKEQTAQRALEGFVRSCGKEIRKGSTSQLIYVAPGAENQLDSTLRFFLSSKSAYVSAQVVRISKAAEQSVSNWEKPLAEKVALVTGASRGIGKAIAETLARDGAKVVCLDIPPSEEELKAVATELGGEALALDITAEEAPQTITDYFKNNHQGLDIIVHNAGVTRDKTLGRMKPQFWDMTLDINLSSEERINDALLAADAINENGRVICVSSISGIAGNMGQTNYSTSKAGVIGMVQSMSPVLNKKNITINAVAPGFIETAMTAAIPFAIRQAGRRMNSMSQGGLPVDVAEAIAWYANPASAGVTGNVVRVCGQSLLGA
ncbi:3-oxoacyl-(acyl-carrier-protein) reductase [gamma proteobacterium HTCC5015]|nr:3-oxoacyl-(acyl-carrier-protein) reductase [gamma proteobacterium HTCC5015]